jgi:hypothetical protein
MNKLYLYNGMLYCEDCMKELEMCNTASKEIRTSLACSICDFPYSQERERDRNLIEDSMEFDN